MNFASKYAGRVLIALAATTGLFCSVGCGSGNSIAKTNPSGFSTSSLNGTYVFSSTGSDSASGDLLAVAGTVVANGSGGITGGTMDIIDPELTPASPVAQAITGGTYTVGSDGRGRISITSSGSPLAITLDFVLTSNSHGLVTEFDGNGSGSGTIDLQTALSGLSQIAGSYAFSISGSDAGLLPFATVGAFTLNSTGTSTAGIEDFNENGISLSGPLTATATINSGTGPGTLTLNANYGLLQFDFYPIDSTHFKVIETDYKEFLVGDVFTQTGASIPTGAMVFTMAGGTSATGPIAAGGLMTSDGTGNFSAGLEDVNESGTVPAQLSFSGAVTAAAGVGGRVVVGLTGFVPATTWVVYPSSGGLLILETDNASVTTGVAFAQTATSFAASQDYGLNLSADNADVGEVDDIAQFATTSTKISGALDENELGATGTSISLNGTYGAPTSGRGSITVPNINTDNGTLNLIYYVVDSSTTLFIEVDGAQVGSGLFELQSSGSSGAIARSRVSIVHPLVHVGKLTRRK